LLHYSRNRCAVRNALLICNLDAMNGREDDES